MFSDLPIIKRFQPSKILAIGLLASSSIMAAQAGNMFVYKDSSGQVLLTNVNPTGSFDKFTQKVKATYYPSSTYTGVATSDSSANDYSNYAASNSSSKNSAYDHYITASANRNGVDAGLMKAMMHAESSFNPQARSHAGAQGLMQLMPATASRFSVNNPWNPSENIEGAAKYIAWLSKRFDGNLEHVVAGYNAGEGNVDKYGGIPPFKETRNYVKKVMKRYNNQYKNDMSLRGSTGFNPTLANNTGAQRVGYNRYGTINNYTKSAYDALR